MSFTVTITSRRNVGALRLIEGTFTSASGDSSLVMTASDHGLNMINFAQVDLAVAAMNHPNAKITISDDSITALWDDTQGYSGRFSLMGR